MKIKFVLTYSPKRRQELSTQTGETTPENYLHAIELSEFSPEFRARVQCAPGEFWETLSGFYPQIAKNGLVEIGGSKPGCSGRGTFPLIWDAEFSPTAEEIEPVFWKTEAAALAQAETDRIEAFENAIKRLQGECRHRVLRRINRNWRMFN